MAKKEPLIKYTPRIAAQIFSILIKTNMNKACEYGKMVITTTTYEKPAGYIIKWAIEDLSREISLTPEICQLGIEAVQVEIDDAMSCYPEIRSTYKRYSKMAEWYWLLGNKLKAIEAQEKAIEALKNTENPSLGDLAAFESLLRKYKKE